MSDAVPSLEEQLSLALQGLDQMLGDMRLQHARSEKSHSMPANDDVQIEQRVLRDHNSAITVAREDSQGDGDHKTPRRPERTGRRAAIRAIAEFDRPRRRIHLGSQTRFRFAPIALPKTTSRGAACRYSVPKPRGRRRRLLPRRRIPRRSTSHTLNGTGRREDLSRPIHSPIP